MSILFSFFLIALFVKENNILFLIQLTASIFVLFCIEVLNFYCFEWWPFLVGIPPRCLVDSFSQICNQKNALKLIASVSMNAAIHSTVQIFSMLNGFLHREIHVKKRHMKGKSLLIMPYGLHVKE